MRVATQEREEHLTLQQVTDHMLKLLKNAPNGIHEQQLIRQVYVYTNEIIPDSMFRDLRRKGIISNAGKLWKLNKQ